MDLNAWLRSQLENFWWAIIAAILVPPALLALSFFGIGRPKDETLLVLIPLFLVFIGLVFILWKLTRDTQPNEILLRLPRSKIRFFFVQSPLRLALITNVGILVLLYLIAFPDVPTFSLVALVLFILFNFGRELFTVHYTSSEVVKKLLAQSLTTLHGYSENRIRILADQHIEFKVRTNIMLCDPSRTYLQVALSYNMADDADQSIRFETHKGISGKAFHSKKIQAAAATNPKEWNFEDRDIKILRQDLQWVWSCPILDRNESSIGVLNIDTNYPMNHDETIAAIASLCQDFAAFISLAYQLRPYV